MALSCLVLALVASSLHGAAGVTVGSVSGRQLLPGLTASWAPGDGDGDIAFNLTWTGDGWIGIGFSRGTAVVSGTMFGAGPGGPGADLFVCSDTNDVRRIWAVNRNLNANAGDVVPNAKCMFEGGQTTMSFARLLAAENGNQLAVTPGTQQMVIWAHAAQGGQRTLMRHGPTNRGGMLVDFGATPGPAPTGAPNDSSGAVYALAECTRLSMDPRAPDQCPSAGNVNPTLKCVYDPSCFNIPPPGGGVGCVKRTGCRYVFGAPAPAPADLTEAFFP